MSERMLTTEEAGRHLGVTSTRVRAMITAGRLTAQKFGPVYMILESDLQAVENRKTGRPPKSASSTEKRATGRRRARNGTSTGKQKGKK